MGESMAGTMFVNLTEAYDSAAPQNIAIGSRQAHDEPYHEASTQSQLYCH